MEISKDDVAAYAEDRADSQQQRRVNQALESSRDELLQLVEELYPVTNQEWFVWKCGKSADEVSARVEAQVRFPGSTAQTLNEDFVRRGAHPDHVAWGRIMQVGDE